MDRQEAADRIVALRRKEMKNPKGWWWLSFADETKNLGVLLIEAQGIITATSAAFASGLNPGGSVAAYRLEGFTPPLGTTYRLLSPAEADEVNVAYQAQRRAKAAPEGS